MITREENTMVTAQCVADVIGEFMSRERPRMDRLRDAYAGRGAITRRVRASGLPNNRLVHAFPRYITTMAAGYLAGKPVQYAMAAGDETQRAAFEALRQAYRACNIDSVDAELATEASIYGKGVCIAYVDDVCRPRAAVLDARQAFVVYDDTVEHRPLFGVYWRATKEKPRRMIVSVCTRDEVATYEGMELSALEETQERKKHFFGGVPVIEFWNNAQETGDFEPVLSLIDAYDALESDRVNDKQQFTDAILLLTGCTLENADEEDARSPAQKLLEERTLSLPDTDAKAEWLVKHSDEAGTEILREAIKADIHKMSMVPDLTDEHFAANASGVAMRYKLLGFEQLTREKERWFREGLRSRLRLFAHFLCFISAGRLNAEAIEMTFTRALPVNEAEAAQTVALLRGIVPEEILLAQLPFVEDARAAANAVKRADKEKAR